MKKKYVFISFIISLLLISCDNEHFEGQGANMFEKDIYEFDSNAHTGTVKTRNAVVFWSNGVAEKINGEWIPVDNSLIEEKSVQGEWYSIDWSTGDITYSINENQTSKIRAVNITFCTGGGFDNFVIEQQGKHD